MEAGTLLREEIRRVRTENARLRGENASLRGDVVRLEMEKSALLDQLDGLLHERSQYALYPQPT